MRLHASRRRPGNSRRSTRQRNSAQDHQRQKTSFTAPHPNLLFTFCVRASRPRAPAPRPGPVAAEAEPRRPPRDDSRWVHAGAVERPLGRRFRGPPRRGPAGLDRGLKPASNGRGEGRGCAARPRRLPSPGAPTRKGPMGTARDATTTTTATSAATTLAHAAGSTPRRTPTACRSTGSSRTSACRCACRSRSSTRSGCRGSRGSGG